MQELMKIFKEALELEDSVDIENIVYNTIPQWDSIGHMALIAEIEDTYDIMLDTDDVLDMSSFAKARAILSKYNVEF